MAGPDATATTPAPAPPKPLARWLRARVLALRASTRRRTFPPTVELVAADAAAGDAPLAAWCYAGEDCDHGLRVDVLVRMLTDCRCHGVSRAVLVHVRPGPHEPADTDLGWAAAGSVAAAIADVELASVLLVSRWGWLDLVSGAQRSWVRPRHPAG
jgi:hypothetical protein